MTNPQTAAQSRRLNLAAPHNCGLHMSRPKIRWAVPRQYGKASFVNSSSIAK